MSDRKSTRLNSSHTEIYTLSLHDALPIFLVDVAAQHRHHVDGVVERRFPAQQFVPGATERINVRSEEHTSELQSHRDLHSFPTRRSSDLSRRCGSAAPPSR